MKLKVISYGQRKNGIKTAQVVIVNNGKSFTKHLWNLYGMWVDVNAVSYQLTA